MIHSGNLRLLRDGAIILQTSRGSVVNEPDLIAELSTGRIRAAIDVTDPEPPAQDSPLRSLPNVVLTPHLAGATGSGCWRMGNHTVREIENVLSGKPPVYAVTRDMLDRMA
jgi:phosphoglycerate dehydrogenase-like enzyme